VNQGGRFQRLPWLLLGQTLGGEPAQLVVHQRQQPCSRVRITSLDGMNDFGDFAHGARPMNF
jgi:hypothetical protein